MTDERTMVRVGIVSAVDEEKKMVRVYYPDLSDMVSDWLFVLQRPFKGEKKYAPFHVDVTVNPASLHTHTADVSYSDNAWLPAIDDNVLVLYTYGFNSAGYVLGVV